MSYLIEPILEPFENVHDGVRFHNGSLAFEKLRIHKQGSESTIESIWSLDDDELEPFIQKPASPWAVDFAVLMGIVNVTPDSFSDGGQYFDPKHAIHHAQTLIEQGAVILDFGAESTRPGADLVTSDEELHRLAPIFAEFSNFRAIISVDTRKAEVAQAAIDAGAHIINDISAMEFDPEMAEVIANSEVSICLMHTQGLPKTMQDNPRYDDILFDIYHYLESRIEFAMSEGIDKSRIMIDPGLGFGKTLNHNLTIMRHLSLFHGLGCPLLLGSSRKSFINKITPAQADERLGGSMASAMHFVDNGVQILRVHDVFETSQAMKIHNAIKLGVHNHE